MKRYEITYYMHPHKNIVVTVLAENENDAAFIAKQLKDVAFSIKELK